MRDGNRLKEKIELRLDQRQVVSFVMVALVLAGAIFALGVLVGKNLASMPSRPGPARNEDLLARLDENAKAGPEARALLDGGPDGLTFQEELTRPETADKKKAPKVEEKKPVPKAVKPAVDAGVVAVQHADAGTLTATAKPTPTPIATPTPTPTPKPSPAAEVPSSFFTIQVKATQSKDDADRFVAKLEGSGYHPFVAEVDLAGKGHWYRVRVGKFENRPKAEKYLADFKRETHLEAFVTAAGH